ncbi:uncharacterized protein LOC118435897 [Folsomia candida]|uniref:uncharacterized protein LOC118435897 n=1 Tax=Folsomia candida TaxID=158441 RepID=UPI0016053C48|nr:uncharacterized protein LOC118435897 [Folsomia candida]
MYHPQAKKETAFSHHKPVELSKIAVHMLGSVHHNFHLINSLLLHRSRVELLRSGVMAPFPGHGLHLHRNPGFRQRELAEKVIIPLGLRDKVRVVDVKLTVRWNEIMDQIDYYHDLDERILIDFPTVMTNLVEELEQGMYAAGDDMASPDPGMQVYHMAAQLWASAPISEDIEVARKWGQLLDQMQKFLEKGQIFS